MHVIGTAGHVDHGKSTLTHALTGINPDRLEEEQRREMTIDLGFAWLDLPNGERVGIVDVPGHRDFIENMLAGVGGIDAAILVVAADEGVMPQTREHLAILDLLGIPAGLIALTKIDLVDDPDWLELVQLDIIDIVHGTVLQDQPLIPVSAVTGEGLDDLVAALTALLAQRPPRADTGKPRLPVDRVFTISGFGVVVTGTLLDGSLSVGQEVELQPSGITARIRGIQSHEKSLEHVEPGNRAAVNLRGVEKSDLRRGDVLGLPGVWHPTTLLDAWLRLLPDAQRPLAHNDAVKVFVGAAEVTGRVRVLDRDAVLPGDVGWVQIRLDQPLVAAYGDRYIVRRPSPAETIGGGIVLDTAPGRRWKRFRPDVIARLETLLNRDPLTVALLELADTYGPVPVDTLDLDADQRNRTVESGQLVPAAPGWVIHAASLDRLVERTVKALRVFHAREPLRQGMPPEMLRSRLPLDPDAFEAALDLLVERGHVALVSSGAIRLPDHEVVYTAAQQNAIRELAAAFDASPYTPPTVAQARDIVGDAVLLGLIERGELVRISDDVLLAPDVLREWVMFTRDVLERGDPLTVVLFRDHFGTTRRYALAFLERLDALGITRRSGDERVSGSGAWERLL
ncbi:MAG: selenocysteine-specific translation elongation factor [Anaerolineae bacterium]|nr:selenocysteine-specific translation elongation factor [Anaerolineae bacterium]